MILESHVADPGRIWYCDDGIYDTIRSVGVQYGVPYQLLLALVCYEDPSFDPYTISPPNSDGSYDYGLFQINTFWTHPIDPNWPPFDLSRYADPVYITQYACDIILANYNQSHDWYQAIHDWTTRDKAWPLYQEWTAVQVYTCPHCGATFTSKQEFDRHILNVHAVAPPLPPITQVIIPAGLITGIILIGKELFT